MLGVAELLASPKQDAPIISCKFGQLQSCQDSDTEARGSHAPGSVFRLHCIARNLSAEVTFLEIYPTEDSLASCFGAVRSLLE